MTILRHTYQSEAGADGGEGGGAPPADQQTPPAGDNAPPAAPAVTVEQLQAQIAAMQAKLDGADEAAAAAAEQARLAAMSDAERAQEQLAAERAKLDEALGGLRKERLTMAADKLGVLPNFRGYLPDVDPSTTDGAAALEQWAKDHPQALKPRDAAPDGGWRPAPEGNLAKILSGKLRHPLVTAESIRKLGGLN